MHSPYAAVLLSLPPRSPPEELLHDSGSHSAVEIANSAAPLTDESSNPQCEQMHLALGILGGYKVRYGHKDPNTMGS